MNLERLESQKIDMDCYKDIINKELPDAAPYMDRVSFPSGECLLELHSLCDTRCSLSQKHLTSK